MLLCLIRSREAAAWIDTPVWLDRGRGFDNRSGKGNEERKGMRGKEREGNGRKGMREGM